MSHKSKAMQFANESYNVNITGRNVAVTDAMKQYAIDKVAKVERFSNRMIDVHVIMDIQKLEQRVEIIFKAGNTKITSYAATSDMYQSIDEAVKKLEAQIRRYKSKIQDHHARDVSSVEMNVEVVRRVPYSELDEDAYEVQETTIQDRFKPHQIVDRVTKPLHMLTYDEAVMKMELSNDPFLIFKNEADQKLKVMYRRKDGHFGIIEPKV